MEPTYVTPRSKQFFETDAWKNREIRVSGSKRSNVETSASSFTSLKGNKSEPLQNPWEHLQLPDDDEPQTFLQQSSEDPPTPSRQLADSSSRSMFQSEPNISRQFGRKPIVTRGSPSKALVRVQQADQATTRLELSHRIGLEDDATGSEIQQSNSFQIRNTDKVTLFLQEKLIKLQQQVCKKIAKSWIKEICPKKQARYPYSRNKGVADQPEWWPPLDKCMYKEPDHLAKPERVHLLIHLLRLRPSPEKVKEWLGDAHETSRANPMYEWTRFLKEKTLSDSEIVPQGPVDPGDVISRERLELLNNLFSVAEMEEDYEIGGRDGTDTVVWTPDLKKLSELNLPSKRSRNNDVSNAAGVIDHSHVVQEAKTLRGTGVVLETNVVSQTPTPSETSSSARQEKTKRKYTPSDTSSESSSRARAKRTKTNPSRCDPAKSKRSTRKRKGNAVDDISATPLDTLINETSASSSPPFPPDCNLMFPVIVDSKPSSYQQAAFNSSFGSTNSGWYDSDGPWHMQRSFAEDQILGHPMMSQPTQVEVRRVYRGNHPQFQATPNVQMNADVAHDLNTSSQDHYVPAQIWYGGLPKVDAQGYERFPGHVISSYGGFRAYEPSGNNVVLEEQRTVQPDQLYGPNMQHVSNGPFDAEWSAPPPNYQCEASLSYIPPGLPEAWTTQLNWTPQ